MPPPREVVEETAEWVMDEYQMLGWEFGRAPSFSRKYEQSKIILVGEGQTEENHTRRERCRIGGGGSFGVFPGLWTMACD